MEKVNYTRVLKSINESLSEIEDKKNEVGLKCQELIDILHNSDTKEVYQILESIDSMTTDEVAIIYYGIQDSHHFKHIDKFKPI